MVMPMVQVIYADILFIVNFYVNYVLLKITAQLLKRSVATTRCVLSSALGAVYAFIILVPDMSNAIIAFSRFIFAFAVVLTAYGYKSTKVYLRSVVMFFVVSFVFSGIMYFLWEFFSPPIMAYRNTVVYFDIDAFDLFFMTVVCYGILKLLELLLNARQVENLIYEVTVHILGESFFAKTFLDTGNSLTEPFSSYPVILLNENIKSSNNKSLDIANFIKEKNVPLRLIPCKTISNETLLYSFRPDKVKIKGIDIDIETDKIYIALTKTKLKGGDYDALVGSAVFEGKTSETEADYSKQTV